MDEVVQFTGSTIADVPVGKVLDGARNCSAVLVLGLDQDGELYAASTTGDVAQTLFWIEQFKFNILNGVYG